MIRFALTISIETYKKFSQLVSTSNKRPSSADKGVTLVVMDKSQYIDKCMALLDDTKVYKPCKRHYQKTTQRCPGSPVKAQQRTQHKQVKLVEQNVQQIAPDR